MRSRCVISHLFMKLRYNKDYMMLQTVILKTTVLRSQFGGPLLEDIIYKFHSSLRKAFLAKYSTAFQVL